MRHMIYVRDISIFNRKPFNSKDLRLKEIDTFKIIPMILFDDSF